MTRSQLPTFLVPAFAGLLAACGDDSKTTTDTAADTLVDTTESVDTATETGTDTTTTDATTADTTDTVGPTTSVVMNEISVSGVDPDWVELFNAGSTSVDLGGWTLRDDDPTHGYTFPASTVLAPGAYLAVDADPDGLVGFAFGFGDQDGAFLFDRDQVLVDQTVWVTGEAKTGTTWGRYPNGTGSFMTLYTPTKGEANVENPAEQCGNDVREGGELCDGNDIDPAVTCERYGWGGGTVGCAACKAYSLVACTAHAAALVVNEVSSEGTDQIELFNGTGAAIDLNGYQVKDDADNAATIGKVTIDAGGYLVLVKDLDFTFGLGAGDAVTLLDGKGNVVDAADWRSGEANPSYCRIPNGTGGFQNCAAATFGAAND